MVEFSGGDWFPLNVLILPERSNVFCGRILGAIRVVRDLLSLIENTARSAKVPPFLITTYNTVDARPLRDF